jgi:hypothetical protein
MSGRATWSRNRKLSPRQFRSALRGMRDAVEGWEVTGYGKHMALFEAVDKKDRHVAAAADKLSLGDWPGQKVALITKNVKDFPQRAFKGTDVTR